MNLHWSSVASASVTFRRSQLIVILSWPSVAGYSSTFSRNKRWGFIAWTTSRRAERNNILFGPRAVWAECGRTFSFLWFKTKQRLYVLHSFNFALCYKSMWTCLWSCIWLGELVAHIIFLIIGLQITRYYSFSMLNLLIILLFISLVF